LLLSLNKALAFYIKYGFNPDYEISNTSPDVPDMQPYTIWGTSSLDLSNSGDELLLLDGRDELIDPFPTEIALFT
jgi:hypothetical protein